MLNPYKVLGVNPTMSTEQIKREYKRLAKIYHPDVYQGDTSKFNEIKDAWKEIEKYHKPLFVDGLGVIWKHKSIFSIYKEEL